jgi:hypothetical protein
VLDDPLLVRYASCFIAMRMGQRLLKDMEVGLESLDHRNFSQAQRLVAERGEAYFKSSVADVESGLRELYGDKEVSVQQLSATFRRGDLIRLLQAQDVKDGAKP